METQFDKSAAAWPYKAAGEIKLDACFRSPMSAGTVAAISNMVALEAKAASAIGKNTEFCNPAVQGDTRHEIAALLDVHASEISLHVNTEEALRAVALRYPFDRGDKVAVYRGDYPSVYKPFAERRDIACVFLNGETDTLNRPVSWSIKELEHLILKERPKMVAISHVLYRSGFKADLAALSELCKTQNVKLVLDVAQSVGLTVIRPAELGVDAVAFPLWKGLNGPRGTAALWTSRQLTGLLRDNSGIPEDIRSLIDATGMTSIDAMDARALETSTLPTNLFAGARTALKELLRYNPAAVSSEGLRLQLLFAARVDGTRARPVVSEEERGGLILSFYLPRHHGREQAVVEEAQRRGLWITNRNGMVRVAPHYYVGDEEIERAAAIFNDILKQ